MYKIISLKRIMLCIAGMAAAVICCNLIFSAMSRNAVQTANNARNDGIELPILMYHGILKDTKLQGDYGKTTTIAALCECLKSEYEVVSLSFEGIGNAGFENEQRKRLSHRYSQ